MYLAAGVYGIYTTAGAFDPPTYHSILYLLYYSILYLYIIVYYIIIVYISLGPRRSGGGADDGEEESAWYLLHAHARIYRTFYRIIIRICTSNV